MCQDLLTSHHVHIGVLYRICMICMTVTDVNSLFIHMSVRYHRDKFRRRLGVARWFGSFKKLLVFQMGFFEWDSYVVYQFQYPINTLLSVVPSSSFYFCWFFCFHWFLLLFSLKKNSAKIEECKETSGSRLPFQSRTYKRMHLYYTILYYNDINSVS